MLLRCAVAVLRSVLQTASRPRRLFAALSQDCVMSRSCVQEARLHVPLIASGAELCAVDQLGSVISRRDVQELLRLVRPTLCKMLVTCAVVCPATAISRNSVTDLPTSAQTTLSKAAVTCAATSMHVIWKTIATVSTLCARPLASNPPRRSAGRLQETAMFLSIALGHRPHARLTRSWREPFAAVLREYAMSPSRVLETPQRALRTASSQAL